MKVKAIKDYFDLELNRAVKALEEYEVSADRAKVLGSSNNIAGFPLVEVIEKKPAAKRTSKKAVKDE